MTGLVPVISRRLRSICPHAAQPPQRAATQPKPGNRLFNPTAWMVRTSPAITAVAGQGPRLLGPLIVVQSTHVDFPRLPHRSRGDGGPGRNQRSGEAQVEGSVTGTPGTRPGHERHANAETLWPLFQRQHQSAQIQADDQAGLLSAERQHSAVLVGEDDGLRAAQDGGAGAALGVDPGDV